MNKFLISIGSNTDGKSNLSLCRIFLDSYFENITYSEICETEPYGDNYSHNFINQIAFIESEMNIEQVQSTLKSIEYKIGRRPEDKQFGLVKIDVDLVVWNKEIIKPKDLERNYVKDLIPTLPENKLKGLFTF